jgi:hypothetical protein
MTHKEFFVWLEGFMTNRDWTTIKQVDIEVIQEKMKEVKDEPKFGITEPYRTIPMPVNPFPKNDDPFKPPYEIYCNNKTQLND